jgi:hypothetical protein
MGKKRKAYSILVEKPERKKESTKKTKEYVGG